MDTGHFKRLAIETIMGIYQIPDNEEGLKQLYFLHEVTEILAKLSVHMGKQALQITSMSSSFS